METNTVKTWVWYNRSAALLKIHKDGSNYNKREKYKPGMIIKLYGKICTHRRLTKKIQLNIYSQLSLISETFYITSKKIGVSHQA